MPFARSFSAVSAYGEEEAISFKENYPVVGVVTNN